MNRRSCLALVLVLAAAAVGAHEGHEHKAMGTLAAVDASRVDLTTQDGATLSFQLGADTKVLRGKTPAKLEALQVGERAVVMYVEKDGSKLARRVILAAAKLAASPSAPPAASPTPPPPPGR